MCRQASAVEWPRSAAGMGPPGLQEPLPLHERTLAAIWNAQRPLQGPFWTTAHAPVAVIYRGQWAGGPGPDFRGAIVALGDEAPRRGDVELHLRAADWYAHGHHTDPAYNDVVLHVVYTLGTGAEPARLDQARRARTAAGREVPTLVLGPHILGDPAALAALDLPDPLADLSEEPCWERTQHWSLEEVRARLAAAGDARFAEKSARFEGALAVALGEVPAHEQEDAAAQVLYAALADALGYSANRAPFTALAARLPVALLRILAADRPLADRTAVLEAALLGGAGLLPSQRARERALDWQSAAQGEELELQWAALRPLLGHLLAGTAAGPPWQFAGGRPANAPPRRVAALAHLLAPLLPGGLLTPWVAEAHAPAAPAEQAARWLARLRVVGQGAFWRAYSDFGAPLSRAGQEADLIGPDRAADLLVNVLLPFLDAWSAQTGDAGVGETARAVWAAAPRAGENAVTRAMLRETLGPRARAARLGAREQQGLIGLYRRYCSLRNVYECPLSGLCRPGAAGDA